MNATKSRLRKVMVDALDLGVDPETIPDKDLVSTLGLDSINTIEYLIWVEGEFNIEIADEDLSIDLIDDLDKLASYVEDRQPASAQAS
ncbi:MAG TPA: phosphopantetheine-binding protein [Streptosporangiaceae bacterium]|jgi:acyl carrier protein